MRFLRPRTARIFCSAMWSGCWHGRPDDRDGETGGRGDGGTGRRGDTCGVEESSEVLLANWGVLLFGASSCSSAGAGQLVAGPLVYWFSNRLSADPPD